MLANFPKRLSHAMQARGFSQEALAAKMDVSHSAVSRWLKGSQPRPAKVASLAETLGVDVRWLLDGETDRHGDDLPPLGVSLLSLPGTLAEVEVSGVLSAGPKSAAEGMSTEEILAAHSQFLSLLIAHPHPTMRQGYAVSLEALAAELARRIASAK